jgi:hypothetical protein
VHHLGEQVTAEPLEQRRLLAAPVIDAVANLTLPSSRSLTLPLTATDPDSDRLTYRTRTSTPQLVAKLHRKTNPFVRLRVSGLGGHDLPAPA